MKYIYISMLLCAVNAQDNEQQQEAGQKQGTAQPKIESTQTSQTTRSSYDDEAEAQRRRDLEIQSYILPG